MEVAVKLARLRVAMIAGAALAISVTVAICVGGSAEPVRAAATAPRTAPAAAPAAAPGYTIEQAISDRAQENTIAFDALGFLTGTLGSDSFFPPGKVADFWGFQYLRDNDPSEMGHNTDFLTSAALNMLSVLTTQQRAELISLARSQVDSINDCGYKRFVLMKAFRRLLEGDLPPGATGLDQNAVKAYSAELYGLDGRISYERAQVMGPILAGLSSEQKAYLDAMVGKGMTSWPKVGEPAELKGLTRDEKVAVMTYAGDLFSWYAGDIEADTYFCPERHGTYFGSFYLKDAPAVGNPNYTIDTTITGNLGAALLGKLTSTQAKLITDLVDIQRPYLTQIVDVRRAVATELREFRLGRPADAAEVSSLMAAYGELDGEIVYNLATNFAKVGQSLTASEDTELMKLRLQLLGDLAVPAGAYLYSQAISMPDIPDTDFLFGVAGGGTGDDSTGGSSFSDISSSPYRDAIEQVAAREIINGYADGTFRPDSPVTRTQFAKMIVKTLGYAVSPDDSCPFGDVPKGLDPNDPLYPYNYVAVCVSRGITRGTTSSTFGPTATISRAQLITMVARAAGLPDPPSGYSPPFAAFDSEHYPWARKAAGAGLLDGLQGMGAGYDFWTAATRGECAQLLSGLLADGASPPAEASSPDDASPPADESSLLERQSFPGTVILGRPTDSGATLSLMSDSGLDLYVEYGGASGVYAGRTAQQALAAGSPLELPLSGLRPDSECFYRICFRPAGSTDFEADAERSFHTQRAAGGTFTFAVEADPHIDVDRKMEPALFRAALANIGAAHPDFLIDLGDTFLGEKLSAPSQADIEALYSNAREYFGLVGPSVPLFLATGNHEGEFGWALDGTADNLSVWATNARKAYYPNPYPDGFYSGGGTDEPFTGLRESYYSWEWGNALFVVLDPYSYVTSDPKKTGDLWLYTLGDEQYQWLEETLRTSSAKYKFVFSHHILGDVRGGIEWAGLYEWGGSDKNGTYQFAQKRPDWDLPIHELFVNYGVTIYFQGHDHFYVRQEMDGVVYQEVPQPATPGGDPQNMAHEYAYKSGVILGSPGILLVTVSAGGVKVDYVHSSTGSGDDSGFDNGEVVYSYTL
jgi:hypothetical protein